MNKISYCFINGKFIKEDYASISVNDIGLHRGYGVFEVLRTYGGKPFMQEVHLNRLLASAAEINIKVPFTKAEISAYVKKLIKKNEHNESLIKIILTGGVSADGITPGKKPTFIILVKKLKEAKPEFYQQGIKLITYEYERFFPSAKTLNYIHLVKSLEKLKKENAFSLLYFSNDKVLEGATCNIFIFKENKLITPDHGILNGITRNLIIEIANKHYPVQKKSISLKDLYSSQEAFVTMTTKGIVPVVNVDNKKIGNGKPGINTNKLMELFNRYATRANILS